MDAPLIRLWELEELALVIECSSGVIYSNQAGGNYCLQPEAEGVLVPPGAPAMPTVAPSSVRFALFGPNTNA